MSDIVDVSGFVPQLAALTERARAATGLDGEPLLQQARRLLAKVRAAPVISPQPDSSEAAAVWCAVAEVDDVICWRGDAELSLYGKWTDGRLRIVQIVADGTVWGMRVTTTGTSYFGPGKGVEGPADARILERIKRQTREARQRVAREVAERDRVCPRCSWVNERGQRTCAFCGVAGVPWTPDAQVPEQLTIDHVEPLVPTQKGGLPTEFEETALPRLPSPPPPIGPQAVRGGIVIYGVHPDCKANVVRVAADACEQAGLGRPTHEWIAAQIERLPALLCRNASPAQAADIQRRLADAGASARFEVGHG